MTSRFPRLLLGAVVAVAIGLSQLPASAQTGEGAKFYAAYRAAAAKAKSINDLLPYLSKAQAEKMKKTPPDDAKMMFELMMAMQPKDVKVVKESKSATGYTLEVTGTGEGKASMSGTVTIVREDGALKLDRESWKG